MLFRLETMSNLSKALSDKLVEESDDDLVTESVTLVGNVQQESSDNRDDEMVPSAVRQEPNIWADTLVGYEKLVEESDDDSVTDSVTLADGVQEKPNDEAVSKVVKQRAPLWPETMAIRHGDVMIYKCDLYFDGRFVTEPKENKSWYEQGYTDGWGHGKIWK